jgi:hypothetical protein
LNIRKIIEGINCTFATHETSVIYLDLSVITTMHSICQDILGPNYKDQLSIMNCTSNWSIINWLDVDKNNKARCKIYLGIDIYPIPDVLACLGILSWHMLDSPIEYSRYTLPYSFSQLWHAPMYICFDPADRKSAIDRYIIT